MNLKPLFCPSCRVELKNSHFCQHCSFNLKDATQLIDYYRTLLKRAAEAIAEDGKRSAIARGKHPQDWRQHQIGLFLTEYDAIRRALTSR